jgi:hypothetical protein
VSTADATAFFTNVASHLLQAEGKPPLTHIVIYPTNQYTPSVHRLLQITANLYDAATNRFVTNNSTLAWPTVFRPLFRADTNGQIFIAGYREVVGTAMAFAGSAPSMVQLDTGFQVNLVPASDTPFDPLDRNEPLVSGFPLIIGAKQGWPNFNQFAMQTTLNLSRRLQFLRHDPTDQLPYVTNQQYRVAISNAFAIQVWNSYSNTFPRDLQVIASALMTAVITNETGIVLLSNNVARGAISTIPQNTWAGYTNANTAQSSFQLPFDPTTNFLVLPSSTYSQSQHAFLQSPLFENPSSFYVPHWGFSIHPRVHFLILDTAANRIVDYVNLDAPATCLSLADFLMAGGSCGDPYVPDGAFGSIFCTNRGPNVAASDETVPTYGILNQILTSLSLAPGASWNAFLQTPPGYDFNSAIDFFRFNLGYPTLNGTPPSKLYRTNEFYTPYSPTRSLYILTSWAANDPLLHYTITDLGSTASTNVAIDSAFSLSPIPGIASGRLSPQFQPWGGSLSDPHRYDVTIKDPLMSGSDGWDFPTGQTLDPRWLGRVHRGTPWQTLYLKPGAADPTVWKNWLGLADNLEAQSLHPTNDWRLVSLLALLFNTNDLRALHAVNESVSDWLVTLDGVNALTNSTSDGDLLAHNRLKYWIPPFDTVSMTSNSPQASIIANALVLNAASQSDHFYHYVGDIFATPELTTSSPWLNTSSSVQLRFGLTDAAYESIPSQLLALLQPDSIGTVIQTTPNLQIQFTGADGYAYAIQTSSNLLDWTSVTTNYPIDGTFIFSESQTADSSLRFYRSLLLP